MATPVSPVTQQRAWAYSASGNEVYFTQAAPLSEPQAYTFATSQWLTSLGSGGDERFVITPAVESNNLALKFVGHPMSDPLPDPTNRYRGLVGLWGISEATDGTDTEYVGEFLGTLVVETGIVAATGSAIVPSGSPAPAAFFCRLIDTKLDRSLFPGFRVVGSEQDASPILLLDSMGYKQFVVEMRLSAEGQLAAQQLGFLWREI